VAKVEANFRDNGVRFTWWDDHRTLPNRLKNGSPFLLVVDLSRVGGNPSTVLPPIENCLTDCRAIIFGESGCPRSGAIDPARGIVHVQDVLDASILSGSLSRILAEGWDGFQRNCILSNPYHLLFCHGPKMEGIRAVVDQIAPTNITPLIQGEPGTGKELLAQAIHFQSSRRDKPFLKVTCASLHGELLESELFGFAGGLAGGASNPIPGKFELAGEGTLFLDEIADMDVALQEKLLRVLREKALSAQPGSDGGPPMARVIGATTSDLESAVKAGLFREDLYHYLQVVCIMVPPLRERQEEILSLARCFLDLYNGRYGRSYPGFSEETEKAFLSYHWPGNMTELRNAVKQIVVLNDEAPVVRAIVDRDAGSGLAMPITPRAPSLGFEPREETLKAVGRHAAREAERAVIRQMLEETRWNRRKAAELLQISYKALLYKIREYELDQ
jgi:two-component system response regulator AtoC